MFRFETAGESHGECLVATLTGLPAGIPISLDRINREIWRRQQGFGRGGRMKIETLPVEDIEGGEDKKKPVTRPRPGHADLAGAIKYNFHDARYILERASARETTARVAVGALAKALLAEFGIGILSHVIAVGPVELERQAEWEEIVALASKSEVILGCVD